MSEANRAATPWAPWTAETTTKQSNSGEAETPNTEQGKSVNTAGERKMIMDRETVPVRALYDVSEAMKLLSLSRTQIYELIRSRRLVTVTQGRRRLVPAASIDKYVLLLLRESERDHGHAA